MRNTALKLMPTNFKKRIASDDRPAISTGFFDGRPMSTPYFYLRDYPEIREAYGEQPTMLLIMLPSNDLRDFTIMEKNLYLKSKKTGKGIKFRYCDGAQCVFNLGMNLKGKQYLNEGTYPCVCKALDLTGDEACKDYFHFKAWVLNPRTFTVISYITYRFETRSPNSRDNIISELLTVQTITSPDGCAIAEDDFITSGRLIGIPFMLSVKMIEQDGPQKKVFPIWNLTGVGSAKQLCAHAERAMLPLSKAVFELSAGDLQLASAKLLLNAGEINSEPRQSPDKPPSSPQGGTLFLGGHTSSAHAEQDEDLYDSLAGTLRPRMQKQDEKLLDSFLSFYDNFPEAPAKKIIRVQGIIKCYWDGNVSTLKNDQMRACINIWKNE